MGMNQFQITIRFPIISLLRNLFIYPVVLFGLKAGYAQNRITNEGVSCNAFWKKGEQRKLQITQYSGKGAVDKNDKTLSYEAHITILDSASDGYKIQWIFRNAGIKSAPQTNNGFGIPLFNDLKMIFLTDENGAFKSLLNWEEVKDAYVDLFMLSVPSNIDSAGKQAIENTKKLFDNKEMVESTLIREIQIYHSPYGSVFYKIPFTIVSAMQNPFDGTEIPASTAIELNLNGPSRSSYSVSFTRKVDSPVIRKILGDYISRIQPGKKYTEKELDQLLSGIQFSENSEYQVRLIDGWIKQAGFIRKVSIGNIKQDQWFSIELIE